MGGQHPQADALASRTSEIPHQFVEASPSQNVQGDHDHGNFPESSTWSPSYPSNRANRISGRLVKIPSKQIEALEKVSIWGRGEVPAVVLEEIEAKYSKSFTSSGQASSSQPSSPLSHTRSSRRDAAGGKDENHFNDKNPQGSQVPWSSSPPEHYRNPRLQPPPIQEPVPSSINSSQQQIDDQLGQHQHSKTVQKPQHRPAVLVDFPQGSSQSSEVGQEMTEAPNPVLGPLMIAPASLTPLASTPPSAQIIPATLPRSSTPDAVPVARRHRLMKNIETLLEIPRPSDRRQSTSLAPRKSAGHMLAPASGSAEDLTPLVESSDPDIPQPQDTSSPVNATPVIPRARSPKLADQMRIIMATPLNAKQPQSSRSSDKPPPNKTHSQDPYNMFCSEYTDYDASLKVFLRAIISVEELREQMMLHEYLYDDYVRVFSGPYLDYIRSLDDGNGTKPLTTLQWYNKNVKGRPLYNLGHLTEAKVKDALRYYPDEVLKIREQVRGVTSVKKAPRQKQQARHAVEDIAQRSSRRGVGSGLAETQSLPTRPSPRKGPAVIDSKTPIYRAELASDPISTAEGFSSVTKSSYKTARKLDTTPSFQPSTARRASVASEDITSTDASNGREPPTPSGFQSQVAYPSLEIPSSAVVEDTVMMDDVQTSVDSGEGDRDMQEPEIHSPSPGSQEAATAQRRTGVKRPWEAIEDSEARADVQLKYWKVFLEKVYLPSRALFLGRAEQPKEWEGAQKHRQSQT